MSTRVPSDRELAEAALAALSSRPKQFTLPNGTTVDMPVSAVNGLIEMLNAVAEGDTPTVVRCPRELTTQQAANLLRVSRPTVIRLVENGTLPARRVGSHRRIPLAAVLDYRDEALARRRMALDEMTREADELGLYD